MVFAAKALSSKAVLVVGGGTGIGRAIAVAMARCGAQVAVSGRRQQPLDETKNAIIAAGGRGHAIAFDIRDERSVAAGVRHAAEVMGGIDVLVNSAGVSEVGGVDAPVSVWRDIMATNLDGGYLCVRETIGRMPDGGRVINIGSILGRTAVPQAVAYCSSKHGLVGLTRALALDFAPRRITVNAIQPGWVDTAMSRQVVSAMAAADGVSTEEAYRRVCAKIPLGRFVTEEEVAAMAVFLATEGAAAITGQCLSVCGGQSI